MYTKELMEIHTARLSRFHGMKWWLQDEVYGPKNIPRFWRELNEFCWIVYSKAFMSSGMAYLGRIGDIQQIRRNICQMPASGSGLLSEHAKGNALSLPKWAPLLNDSWVLGHIHRKASFTNISPFSPANLWEDSESRVGCTVTARELIGLINFGYVFENGIYNCKNPVLAQAADLIKYNEIMMREERKGMKSIMIFISINHDLREAIRSFDRNTLKYVHI